MGDNNPGDPGRLPAQVSPRSVPARLTHAVTQVTASRRPLRGRLAFTQTGSCDQDEYNGRAVAREADAGAVPRDARPQADVHGVRIGGDNKAVSQAGDPAVARRPGNSDGSAQRSRRIAIRSCQLDPARIDFPPLRSSLIPPLPEDLPAVAGAFSRYGSITEARWMACRRSAQQTFSVCPARRRAANRGGWRPHGKATIVCAKTRA